MADAALIKFLKEREVNNGRSDDYFESVAMCLKLNDILSSDDLVGLPSNFKLKLPESGAQTAFIMRTIKKCNVCDEGG